MLEDKTLLGKIYVGDNENVIFAISREGDIDVSYIYLMNDNGDCKVLIEDKHAVKKLNFNKNHQIYGTYRLRQGCEKTIYFTDNYNPPRYLNLNDVDSFKEIFVGEDKNIFYGDVDVDKLRLQKTYDSIPEIKAKVDSSGVLMPGSYNFSVRYVDEDLNPTEWIYTTEPIMIYHDCTSPDYIGTRASGGNDVEYRKYEATNKSIKVSVDNSNLDHSFIFVQFAMICANKGLGTINDVQYSPLIELNFEEGEYSQYKKIDLSYVFRGDDKTSTGTTDEIIANTMVFDKVKCLEQADNRLIMGNVTEMDIDWCKLQRYASAIGTEFDYKIVSFHEMDESHKSPYFAFNKGIGYQPGEIYSFGIVYVFENGVKSPVYHIPGKNGGNSDIYHNQCKNIKYSNVSSSCEGFDYWGVDCNGDKLAGTPLRHHRFPIRDFSDDNMSLIEESSVLVHYNLIVGTFGRIKSRFKTNFDKIYIKYEVVKQKDGNTDREEYDLNFDYNFLGMGKQEYDVLDASQSEFIYTGNTVVDNLTLERCSNIVLNAGSTRPHAEWKGQEYYLHHKIWKKSQYRFVDLVSFFKDEYDSVKFDYLQEYPQYLDTKNFGLNESKTTVRWMTSSCMIRSEKFTDNDNNQDKIEAFESLDDDEFKGHVVGKRSKSFYPSGNPCAQTYGPPRVELEFDGNDKIKWKLDNGQKEISTAISFYVEKKEEIVRSVKDFHKQARVYGIKFFNVRKPNPKYLNGHQVVGYYIVQNERTEQDMTVLDSAILTPLFKERDDSSVGNKMIVSSGVFANNFTDSTIVKDYKPETQYLEQHLYNGAVGMICPRFKFQKKELYDFKFRHVGFFNRIRSDFSHLFDEGWITQDVQAGTSYNKKINKRKDRDNDGFDLHVFNQNVETSFSYLDNYVDYNIKNDKIFYLRPASEFNKFKDGEQIKIFNASGDNTICCMFSNEIDSTDMFSAVNPLFDHDIVNYIHYEANSGVVDTITLSNTPNINRIPYGYLIREMNDYYTDFQQRPYYVASELRSFDDNTYTTVYNGDCYVSPMKYSTGTLFDIRMKKRNKKATWWQYVVGALGAAGGAVGAVFTGGATAAVIGPSIALIQNGIRVDKAFQAQKKFIDSGGKKILTDNWVKNCIDIDQDDDEIQWMFESIDGLWFESIVNMNMRVGATLTNVTDYLDPITGYNPSDMRMYYMNKLTWPDKEHNDGRMYLGYAQAEIYDINKDFERRNREKMYYALGVEHECCSDCENKFPKRLVYSQKSFSEEKTDNYKVFLPGNYKDISGETGDITEVMFNGTDAFTVLTEEAIWLLKPNNQQQVNPISNTVSFIGTGDYFVGDPLKIAEDTVNCTYGCRHQGSVIKSKYGMFWFSEHDNAIYMLGNGKEGIKDIFVEYGMGKWFEREGRIKADEEFYSKYRYEYPMKDNPSSEIGTGYVLGFDYLYDRLLITKRDNDKYFPNNCAYDGKERGLESVKEYIESQSGWKNICYKWSQEHCCYIIDYEIWNGSNISEYREYYEGYDSTIEPYKDEMSFNLMINQNTGLSSYPTFTDNNGWIVECVSGEIIYRKDDYVMSYRKPECDNSWTISFKPGLGFVSFHSYLPSMYISTSDNLYSWRVNDNNIYRHNTVGDYQEFYEEEYPFVIELVDTDTKSSLYGNFIEDSISINTEAKEYVDGIFLDKRNIFFDKAYFYNRRQMTKFCNIIVKSNLDAYNYLHEYMNIGEGNIAAEKRDIYWHINDFRDSVSDYNVVMFDNDIVARLKFMSDNNMNGWIDTSVNPHLFEHKEWWDEEPMKDSYLCQRYFYDKPHIDNRYKNVRFSVLVNTTDRTLNLDNTIDV